MSDQSKGKRLAAILYFVAAALALLASGIRFSTDREMNWFTTAGGVFCLVMGVTMWRRAAPPNA